MEVVTKKSIDELKNLIDVLSSPEAKIKFLKSLAHAGNLAAFDLLLELEDKLDAILLEKVLTMVLEQGDKELTLLYGKKLIDSNIENGLAVLLPEKLKKWDNQALTDYAISECGRVSGDGHDISAALDFFQKMGIENGVTRKLTEQLLAIKMEDSEDPAAVADLLVRLGQPRKAIYHLLKFQDSSYDLEWAWDIAKEHDVSMKGVVAKQIWKAGLTEGISETVYVEAAQELGYIDRAIKAFKNHVAFLAPDTGRFYLDLVKALISLELPKEVDRVLQKARDHANSIANSRNSPWDAYKEMVDLCDVVGLNEESKDWTIKRINFEINETHRGNAPVTIAEYEKKTNDLSLRPMLFPFYEKYQEYSAAQDLAMELGLLMKAAKYDRLAKLFADSQGQQ